MNAPPAGAPLRARTIYGWFTFVLLAILVVCVPAAHVVVSAGEDRTRALVTSGRTVRVTDRDDVRVQVSHDKFSHYVTGVSVRIDGAWIPLADSGEGPSDVDRPWYRHDGLQPPLPASRVYPPLDVRYVPGTMNAASVEKYEDGRTHLGGTQWLWAADAVALVVAVFMVRVVWRRLQRMEQVHTP